MNTKGHLSFGNFLLKILENYITNNKITDCPVMIGRE